MPSKYYKQHYRVQRTMYLQSDYFCQERWDRRFLYSVQPWGVFNGLLAAPGQLREAIGGRRPPKMAETRSVLDASWSAALDAPAAKSFMRHLLADKQMPEALLTLE